jgi:hypothetical protein
MLSPNIPQIISKEFGDHFKFIYMSLVYFPTILFNIWAINLYCKILPDIKYTCFLSKISEKYKNKKFLIGK